MRDAQDIDHHTVKVTVAKSRSECFLIGARNLVKYIGRCCIKCHILTKKQQSQMMVEILVYLKVLAPPFSHLGLDLFGPLEVRDDVHEQSTRYVHAYKNMWVAVVVSLGMHVAKLYLMCGYSTEYFMFVWVCHKADWGVPLTVYMDKGTQLV